ncbi:preprotein translocase subunit SecG [candidate division Kazan bacterium]|uniref:Protein-export membrane protein SecG n=1 Tax=candidate division Kazan bacterium TaxID=2202143 RepID=A0A420ZD42_UNCK3|nr:MAG: preprotein translocase subunit SecG [candidate division Kazan bacterium]
MEKIFIIIQVIVGVILVAAILFQNRSSSMGDAFGGGGGVFYGTRRGPEKVIFNITIGLAVAFVLISFIVLFL